MVQALLLALEHIGLDELVPVVASHLHHVDFVAQRGGARDGCTRVISEQMK